MKMLWLLLFLGLGLVWLSGALFALWAFLHFMGNVRIGVEPEQ